MDAAPEKDPEKPPGLPSRVPLWVALALLLLTFTGPSRGVWFSAILAIAVFCGLALWLPRKRFKRPFEVLVLFVIFAVCASFAVTAGLYGSAVFGRTTADGGYYLTIHNRYSGNREIGTGKNLYTGIFCLEASTFIGLALMFAAGSTLYPEDAD